MHLPTSRAARALAVAGVLGTVSMAGIGAASAATFATPKAASTTTAVLASPALQASLRTVVWQPPYGCIVCGLGGFDPIFGDLINPALPAAGPVGF